MKFIKNIAESGVQKGDSLQERRSILLTNSISLILISALVILYLIRWKVYQNLANEKNLILGAVLFITPVLLNRFSLTTAAKLFICIVPTIYIWYVFIFGMLEMPVIEVTIYDGLRVFLLAVSCVAFLIVTPGKPFIFITAIIPSIISMVFFESILQAFGVRYIPVPSSDYELMEMRFLLSFGIINGSCFLLQSVILKSEEVNRCLIERLNEKTMLIESQNKELLENRNELHRVNQQLEELLDERAKKIYAQKQCILSYAHANSHYVRGPVARLMGFVELFRLDPELDSKWLVSMIERETKEMDQTIRKLSREFSPVD